MLKGVLLFIGAMALGGFASYGFLTQASLPGLHLNGVTTALASSASPGDSHGFSSLTDEAESLPLSSERAGILDESGTTRRLRWEQNATRMNRKNAVLSFSSNSAADAKLNQNEAERSNGANEVSGKEENVGALNDQNGGVVFNENNGLDGSRASDEKSTELKKINSIDLSRFEAIRGQECHIGLDEIGFRSLSLRRGSFRHGEQLLWEEAFADSPRITMLYAHKSPLVRVHALAFDQNGVPQAAHVQEKSSGREGVIALFVEGKKVPLNPVK